MRPFGTCLLVSVAVLSAPAHSQACGFSRIRLQKSAYHQARLALRQGKVLEAIELYRKAARTPAQAASWVAGVWYSLGVQMREASHRREAAEHYRRALRELPTHSSAALGLAAMLEEDGRFEQALDELERLPKNVQETRPILARRAQLHARMHEHRRALELLRRLQVSGPLQGADAALRDALSGPVLLQSPGKLGNL